MISKMAIIAEQHTLNSLQYAKRGGELLFTNNVYGSPKEIFNDFKLIQELNDRAKNKSIHAIISFNPNDDTNKLTKQDLIDISNQYLKKHGLEENQSAIYLHTEKEHLHLHIISNRIKMDGLCVSSSHNYAKNLEFCKEIEIEYGLIKTNRKEKGVDFVKDNQRANKIKDIIDRAILKSNTLDEFCNNMKQLNVLVLRGRGISFVDSSGAKFKGSEIGREYSLMGIQNQLNNKSTEVHQGKVEESTKITIEPKNEEHNLFSTPVFDGYVHPKHFGEDEEEEDGKSRRNKKRYRGF
jgi:relaxase-like protein